MNEKTAGLAKARAERSLKKRRAVEDALSELKARNETITFKAVATLAGVGRPICITTSARSSRQNERPPDLAPPPSTA